MVAGAQEYLVPLQSRSAVASSKASDTGAVTLPFFDDFSNYEGAPAASLWADRQAFVNKDYAALPPTVGMATLDALDADGNLHATATTSIFSADTLTSRPIRLDSLFAPYYKKLQPADSVCLSFYYLPGGGQGDMWERVGEAPDADDSLFVEFYDPVADEWVTVWGRGGISVDSLVAQTGRAWQYVMVPVREIRYFQNGFRFRFRNYCSLDDNPKPGISGNTDQWNVDYVSLTYNRTQAQQAVRDVAFVRKAPTMLRRYQAMPARQFRQSEMASNVDMTIANLYSQTLTSNYRYYVYDADGGEVSNYDGGYENVPAYLPNGTYQTSPNHAHPAVNFSYPVNGTQQTFDVVHIVTEGATGDAYRQNDTVRFRQVFADYYAYDDGVPENGYGLTSTSGKVYLANRFVLNVADTLSAVDICFNRTRNNENAGIKFYLCVWDDNQGRPGSLIYRDPVRQSVAFNGMNAFVRYRLSDLPVVSGTIYVGMEQQGNSYANIGFDRNNDAREQIYYRTSSDWQQSILSGALMLRPCFGRSALVSVDVPTDEVPHVTLYPNPAKDVVHIDIDGAADAWLMALYDVRGRCCYSGAGQSQISLVGYSPGLYLLQLTNRATGSRHVTKFIVQ